MRVRGPDGKVISFPDDTPPDTIKAVMSRHYGGPPAQSAPPMAMSPQFNPAVSAGMDVRNRLASFLPGIGGFAGGLAGSYGGPPGMVAGAAAGGAGGEALRQGITGEQFNPIGIGAQGAMQGGYEAAGGLIASGASRLARPLMRKALGVVPTLAKRFRTTPEAIAETVIGMRLNASAAGEASAQGASDAIRMARSGVIGRVSGTLGAQSIARVAIADASKAIGRPLTLRERRALIGQVQAEADAILSGRTHGVVPKALPGTPAQPASSILNQYGQPAIAARAPIPPQPSRYSARELEQIKEVAAKQARGAYRADQAGLSVAADPELSRQVASGARRTLSRIPGVPEMNKELQQVMAAKQAISGALAKSSGEWTPLHVGPLSMGFKVPRDKVGNLALILTNKRFQFIARQSPRAAAEALHQLMYSAEPDATSQY